MAGGKKRPLGAVLADIDEAADAVAELIARGKEAWDQDRFLRLAGEALVGRIAEAADRLPDEIKAAMPDVPWNEIHDIRILVDHIYHRIDYDILWRTLEEDVPHLQRQLMGWKREC